MKFIVMLLLALAPALSWSSPDRKILKCLGEEEKRFHLKKEAGPDYDLNQRLISEIVQIPKIEIREKDYLEICTGQRQTESWKLLEKSITEGRDLFLIPKKTSRIEKQMIQGMIDDYIEATREIFLSYISQIQMHSPTPHCLREEIPELDKFFTEIKYLQEDVDLKAIFEGKDQKILKALRNYPLAFEKCRARLKKKVSPVSTPDDKNS